MAFEQEFLDELVQKNDIVDVVGEYVPLKENSGRHWGCCPFHAEKTPSFCVQRSKQMYYCFGCKAGGGVINFVMQIEKLSYPETIEFLARRVNMVMPREDSGNYEELKKKRERITEINKTAALIFHDNLLAEGGKDALAYLQNRGISIKTIKKFGLGFAPDSWDSLSKNLQSRGFTESELLEAGLCKKKDRQAYDAFRNRIIFPIINQYSKVIAFGGRVLDDSLPKYLNSPETPVYNKRKNLYAVNLFKKSLPHIVLLEGYMDVISLYANGIQNVAASLGTALTSHQAHLMKRYTDNIYISYDGDSAGQTAAKKACEILENAGFNVRIIHFEDGLDPDDFIRKFGKDGFLKKMKNSRTIADYNIDLIAQKYDLSILDGKTDYSIAATDYISKITDPVIQERAILRIEKETGFSKESLSKRTDKSQKNEQGENKLRKKWNNSANDKINLTEINLLFAILDKPNLIEEVTIEIEDIRDELIRKILSSVNARIKKGILPTYAELVSEFSETESQKISEMLSVPNKINADKQYVLELCVAINKEKKERRRNDLKQKYLSAEGHEKAKILEELNKISKQ